MCRAVRYEFAKRDLGQTQREPPQKIDGEISLPNSASYKLYSIIPQDLRPAFPAPVPPAAIRAKLQELLGLEDIPQEVDFAAGATTEAEGIGTTTLSFENSLGETVPGLLLQPLDSPPGPGLVCIPGTSGTAERVAHPLFYRKCTGPLYGWGRELARRGFTVLAISPKGCEARRQSPERWATENKLLAPYGRTQMGVLAEEALRAARVLAAITDGRRVGLAGMSLGGNATWYAMACAPWIAAGAPVCGGVGSMARVIHQADIERHSAYYFVPGLLRHFDHAEIVAACMPPRPFMMVAPTRDEDMPRQGVDELVPQVAAAYAASGHPDHFAVYQPPDNHAFRTEYLDWMADFFKRFLVGA